MADQEKEDHGWVRDVAPYLGMGMQLAATITIMVLIGNWLDERYDTSPVYVLIFSFAGAGAGLYHFIKTALQMDKSSKNKK